MDGQFAERSRARCAVRVCAHPPGTRSSHRPPTAGPGPVSPPCPVSCFAFACSIAGLTRASFSTTGHSRSRRLQAQASGGLHGLRCVSRPAALSPRRCPLLMRSSRYGLFVLLHGQDRLLSPPSPLPGRNPLPPKAHNAQIASTSKYVLIRITVTSLTLCIRSSFISCDLRSSSCLRSTRGLVALYCATPKQPLS